MLYDESTASLLRIWLIRTLQPVCDADPEALADYVLALLKHDAAEPDLRKMFISQLEEFLEEEASKFVDTLFAALRSKSYLPYEPIKTEEQQVGIPIPLDDLVSDRGRKRNLETDEDERPSPKGPRLSSDGSFSRFNPSGRRSTSVNARGGPRGEGSSNVYYTQDNGMHMYRPPNAFGGRGRRGICRDYHKNGFCARGSLCQYSHGDDAVVPPMLYPNMLAGVPPFMPMYPAMASLMSNAPYDPHESRMEMGERPQRSSSKHMSDPVSSTELPVVQDLTPQDPVEVASKGDPVIQPNGFTHNFGTPRRMQPQQTHMMPPNMSPIFPDGMTDMFNMGLSIPPHSNDPSSLMHQHQNNMSFKQGSKGLFPSDSQSSRHPPRDDKTLVVEKIPDEKLSMEAVNDWFKKFGTVTNVAIDSSSGKALVTFSNHAEAQNAWKSEEAIFGNRFVKVFWHRPLEGHGAIGQRALAASASFMKSLSTDYPSRVRSHQESSLVDVPVSKVPTTNAAALAARQRALEQQISQQKVLLSRLGAAKTPQEKEEIMESLKSLQNKPLPPTQPTTPSIDSSPQDAALSKPSEDKMVTDHQESDSRVEQKTTSTPPNSGAAKDSQQTAALLEKLSLLKAEATRIGVPDVEINSDHHFPSRPYKPYRGRGGFRGRGFTANARGGPPRGSMKLDNRPRRLLIQGVPSTDEAVQAVRTYYQNLGSLESFGKLEDGQIMVQFWSRATAESALASGVDIPSVGKVKVSWHSGPTPSFAPVSVPSRTTDSGAKIHNDYADTKDSYADGNTVVPDAEESGWGQSFDDEGESRRRRSRSRSFS